MSGNADAGRSVVLFACPLCGEPLTRADRTFRCVNGHAYDIAKEGYVNLLLAQHRNSKDPGYNKEMITARRDFFDDGHYHQLADEIAGLAGSYLPDRGTAVVLDAGCGEGYYLRRMRSLLAPGGVVLAGLDLSKHGIRLAARRDPLGMYAVAGIYGMPVLDQSVDVLLCHFSPVSAADFQRVVRPGGVVLIGGPGEDHLYSLKELLYETPVRFELADTLADMAGFEPIAVHRISYKLALRGRGTVAQLLAMTPFYWSADQATQARLAEMDTLDTDIDVLVHAYRRAEPPA